MVDSHTAGTTGVSIDRMVSCTDDMSFVTYGSSLPAKCATSDSIPIMFWSVVVEPFFQVRKPTDFGFVLDDMGNMPAMVVDATRIRGTDASVDVRYVFGKTYNITSPYATEQIHSRWCCCCFDLSIQCLPLSALI